MAISILAIGSRASDIGNSSLPTNSVALAVGDYIFALVAENGIGDPSSVQFSFTNTTFADYDNICAYNTGNVNVGIVWARVTATDGVSRAGTVSGLDNTVTWTCEAYRISGLAASAPVDVSAIGTGSGTILEIGSTEANRAVNDLAIGIFGTDVSTGTSTDPATFDPLISVTTSDTLDTGVISDNTISIFSLGVTTSMSSNYTLASASGQACYWSGVVAIFKQSSGTTNTGSFTANARLGATNIIVWTSPSTNTGISTTPVLEFILPIFSGSVHFHLQLDKANTFNSASLTEYKSMADQTGWEYWDGAQWQALSACGVNDNYSGCPGRYTVSVALTNGTWYRRIRGGTF